MLIGIDESSSRARISRYELGTHEPPVKTARLLARPWASRWPTCTAMTTAWQNCSCNCTN